MDNLHTLKWYSRLTRKGKVIACRMRFSLSVCSTCFSLTTYNTETMLLKIFQCKYYDYGRKSFSSVNVVFLLLLNQPDL